MPGFVDVSNMTSEEVRRMGHADDYDEPVKYRNPYAYRKPMNRPAKVNASPTYAADDVWAAAWQAFATNGNQYIKAVAPGVNGPTNHKTNRQIVDSLLADPAQITQESREKANEVRTYFKAFTFKILQGKNLNEFNNTAMTVANKDTITGNYDIAVVVSLPATYEKSSKRDSIDRRITFARGGFLGNIGDKVQIEIEVVKRLWSQKWNTWYVTGITDDDKVVFFAFKTQMNVGERVEIQGTVKGQRDTSTQLSRVKVMK